jgi:SAM-dependent methyltransferase
MNRTKGRDGYEFIADLYDEVGPYRERPDIAFYVEAAANARGPVLEVGCGTGRVLIPSARAGASMIGLDLSEPMLAVCRAKLRKESEAVRSAVQLVQADMREFALSRTFALATVPFRPFQHLMTLEDQLSCLETIRRHLIDGGHLILDVFNPSLDALVNRPEGSEFGDEPEFTMSDGRRVVRTHKIVAHDRVNQVNHIELIYYITHPDGRVERVVDAFAMRYFFKFEMEHLLARSGFEVEQVFGGFDRSAYGSQYPGELIFVARKRA